ncbi:hypothetical protein scyTo_0014429 [Scyliorhinus torazame]|uniref:Uncharacterized protein n=1 Tax=Scyliorhinus torazame TaxID=75743 RepID=A0A401NMD9_SCYTO|nr:hypothetical protein [Scyliorhinus torazame]
MDPEIPAWFRVGTRRWIGDPSLDQGGYEEMDWRSQPGSGWQRTGNAEQQVKKEFLKLHQFLFKEEKIALQKLKQEKKKRCQAMRGTIEKIAEEMATLSSTIEEIQELLSEDDHIRFLRKFPEIEKSCRAKKMNPVPVRACPVVNVEQSIGSLQYRVWKKMLTVVSTAPVTLDPYTAHPHLLLSKELTSVSHSMKRQQPLLDRPERFDPLLYVLGREGYSSGKHHWEVVVGQKTEWDLGLARGSINRKEAIDLNPDSGVWIIALRYGNQYRAATKNWRHLDLREKPRKIRVCLDYEGGKVSFYNADSMSHIFTFTDRFHEKLYPFLSPGDNDRGRNHEPLTICPRKNNVNTGLYFDRTGEIVRLGHGGDTFAEQVYFEHRRFEMEDDLSCAVCHDLYKDPVLLDCDHSFCRSCITQYWEEADTSSCPVCRKESPARTLRLNRTLSNIVSTFVKSDKGDQIQQECSRHKEKLKIFCKTDNQPICVVCQISKTHQTHELLPVEEAAEEFKEELRTILRPVQDKAEEWNTVRSEHEKTLTHIQDQSVKLEKQVKAEFEKLHQFLREEERIVLEDLKLEKEKKSQEVKERIEKVTEEISSLSVTVQEIEQELREQDNIQFLTYRVWKKMLTVINTAPVMFDPNTANLYLLLSEDLSTVRNTGKWEQLPDNPERFDRCPCVLGLEGFTSGKHSWEVDVGSVTQWNVGVAKESINRKGQIYLSPKNGYWAMALRDGNQYLACDEPWKNLNLSVQPRKIRVCLDYEGEMVSFYNSDNKAHIYTFTGTFTEKLYPYFSPCFNIEGKNPDPLKICPRTMTIQEVDGLIHLSN